MSFRQQTLCLLLLVLIESFVIVYFCYSSTISNSAFLFLVHEETTTTTTTTATSSNHDNNTKHNDNNAKAAPATGPAAAPATTITTSPTITKTTKTPVTIGYAISITSCESNTQDRHGHTTNSVLDAAAVLQHSIHLSSIRTNRTNATNGNNSSTTPVSKYDYALYAFVHPNAVNCTQDLHKFGYNVKIKDVPFLVSDIQNDALRNSVDKTGCCGAKEFLKLYVMELIDHPIAVHLDLDTLVLKPLDPLFDTMLLPDNAHKPTPFAMWPSSFSSNSSTNHENNIITSHPIDAFFTRDYPMRIPSMIESDNYASTTVQGGFWMVKPSLAKFEEFIAIILFDNEFKPGQGWGGGKSTKMWQYGVEQIQGLLGYYYTDAHPNTSLELNRCYYNTMVDDPYLIRKKPLKNGTKLEYPICSTGQEICQDCRDVNMSEVYTIHYTICMKPWKCREPSRKEETYRLCHAVHQEWHRIRHDLEIQYGLLPNTSSILTDVDEIQKAHCRKRNKYIPIQLEH